MLGVTVLFWKKNFKRPPEAQVQLPLQHRPQQGPRPPRARPTCGGASRAGPHQLQGGMWHQQEVPSAARPLSATRAAGSPALSSVCGRGWRRRRCVGSTVCAPEQGAEALRRLPGEKPREALPPQRPRFREERVLRLTGRLQPAWPLTADFVPLPHLSRLAGLSRGHTADADARTCTNLENSFLTK